MISLGILLFAMVLGMVGFFGWRHTRPARESRQLEGRLSRPEVAEEEILRDRLKQERGLGSLGWFYDLGVMQKLEQSLWQAGIYRRVSDILLVMLLLFGAGAPIGAALWQSPLFAMLLGGSFAMLPLGYVRIKRARRLK